MGQRWKIEYETSKEYIREKKGEVVAVLGKQHSSRLSKKDQYNFSLDCRALLRKHDADFEARFRSFATHNDNTARLCGVWLLRRELISVQECVERFLDNPVMACLRTNKVS